jgi:two-component system, OmpR family, sensor histidine kinase KdpD
VIGSDHEDRRPDPETLIARLNREETGKSRGKLKVFFGASAGVGKTYAMLEQARKRRREGIDVVAGWVETHGRKETASLLDGIEMLPTRRLSYRNVVLEEFDIDAALARRPAVLLLDELAHTNAPGSRHAKRWQDVGELLAAGIDIYTTVNVQHLESLNDIVAQTTGVVMRETVPDHLLDQADEIELVDLTPEDLLQRLREGKVYVPEQAEQAMRSFFSKGNLIALRELAMRKAAERVDAEMRSYKSDQGIPEVWPVTERILVCVSSSPGSMRVLRAAGRMAASLRAEWIVAHVENLGEIRSREEDRARAGQTLRLAEQLGAETVILSGHSVSEEVLAYARSRNVTKIVVGKPAGRWWRYRLLGSVIEDLVRQSDEIDVYVIRGSAEDEGPSRPPRIQRRSKARHYVWGALAVALATGVAALMFHRFDQTNLVMFFLLAVVFTAAAFGRGPSILASLLSVAAFDFFFVEPRMTFAVRNGQYLITFAAMLVVALVTSTLTVRLRQQADAQRRKGELTAALYSLSREFARANTLEEVVKATEQRVGDVFASEVWVLLPDAEGHLRGAGGITSVFGLDEKEMNVAQWVFDHGQRAGLGTATLPGASALYVPLIASRGCRGVLGLFPADPRSFIDAERIHLLDTFTDQTALVLERTLLSREAQDAHVRVEAERLRSSLLSSVSHDLRTPLAGITGAASSLLETDEPLDERTRLELTQSIVDEAERLNRLVGNLLSMTRLESGAVRVTKEWQPLEEVVGAALNHMDARLRERKIGVGIPEGFPLVRIDGVLIEQVFANLIDNALKYTPAESAIDISAWTDRGEVIVEVADCGPGLPAGDEERVFEKFYRGPDREQRGGVGLGLPICRSIIEAHGGRIWAERRAGGGSVFRFALPAEGAPPNIDSTEAVS